MLSFDDIILSLFPPLPTHLNDATVITAHTDPHDFDIFQLLFASTGLFPYDTLIAVIAVTYCRYTVCYTNESRLARFGWSVLVGYFALYRYDYWFQAYIHGVVSFSVFYYQTLGEYYDQYYYTTITKNKSTVDDLRKQAQVLTVVGSIILAIGHLMYSMAYPTDSNSVFQSKFYQAYCINSRLFQILHTTVLPTVWVHGRTVLGYMLPVAEFEQAHDILIDFMDPTTLYAKSRHLLFVTFHIQVGMGYLGIDFLRHEQSRKNALVKIEDEVITTTQTPQNNSTRTNTDDGTALQRNGNSKKINNHNTSNGHGPTDTVITTGANKKKEETYDPSAKFRRSAGPFIFFVALPYMVQIVFYGGVNMYAFHCYRDDLHRTIRLNDLFETTGNRFVATATSKTSKLSPESYATNSETIVTTCYDMINRNLFSLPKLMLLPGIVAKQPMLLLQITPLILLSDWIKSTIVASITNEVEKINKEVKDLESTRTKVEQYDLKNSELIQRSGRESVLFTERKWMKLTQAIQDKQVRTSLMARSKMYFAGLQQHFIMRALVDCALATLIAVGKITAADIFVYARAIEDMINFVLMKSRSESELATMQTSIEVLQDLKVIWDDSEERNLLECTINNSNTASPASLRIQNLSYTRGSAVVSIEDVAIAPGVYAVTGANGSGKSTLFRVIMGCNTNQESVDIHQSIEFTTPHPSSSTATDTTGADGLPQSYSIHMPSSDIVEITQNFYFPLYSSPYDWIYNINDDDDDDGNSSSRSSTPSAKKIAMTKKLENELKSLNFYPKTDSNVQDTNDDSSSSSSEANDTSTSSTSTATQLQSDLTSSKEDWFLDLSGGQKSKVELVRKVFLADHCPDVLLIDETFAPLDPDSKKLVMKKLKAFCTDSIVLVIYHADVKQNTAAVVTATAAVDDEDTATAAAAAATEDGQQQHDACVEGSDFFDHNLHVENGSLILRPVCASEE